MERSETAGGRRLRLAPLLPADAATVASWYADDEFRRLVDARATQPLTVDDVLAEIAEDAAGERSFSYALRTTPADVLIGRASLHDIVWPRRAG
ncbi:MAG: GNAT family N-acetyltransferase [Chloroflexi bacterium]|nr:GNAT family N-acetyltransferase [Chloroflexota bacterium]